MSLIQQHTTVTRCRRVLSSVSLKKETISPHLILLLKLSIIKFYGCKLLFYILCWHVLTVRAVSRCDHTTARDDVVERTLVWRAHGVRYVAWLSWVVNERLLGSRTQRLPALTVTIASNVNFKRTLTALKIPITSK